MVSGFTAQQAGLMFSQGALSKPPINARSPSSPKFIRAHDIMTRLPLVSHPSFCFSCSHIRWRHWRKRIRAPASSGGICGRTSLPAHSYRMEGEGELLVQALQSHICTRWTCLLGGWTSSFSASLDGCAPGLPVQDARQWGSRSGFSLSQGPEERDRPGSTRHQNHRPTIGHSRSSLIMLERHLWLMMTEMKEADKVPFLHTPVSSGSLFGPAVEGVAERFTEVQKSSQCRHFLPKCTCSSSASSRPRPAPTQQTAKPLPSSPEPRPPEGRRDRGRSRSARRYPFPKRQGPRPKIALDPPQKSFWTSRQKEEGPKSRYRWTTLQAASIVSLATPLSSEHKGKCVHGSSWAHYSAQVSDRFDSGQIKTHTFQKERKNNFLPTIIILPLYSQSAQPFQPLCCVGLELADLPRCVNVGNDYGKSRLYTPFRSKTTALPQCSRNHSAQQERSSPLVKSKRWWICWKKEP